MSLSYFEDIRRSSLMVGFVSKIELQALVHSTEDPHKVRTALLNLLSPSDRGSISVSSDQLWGHYRNPIALLKVRMQEALLLRRTIEYLSSTLPDKEKECIASSFDLLSDKSGSLYLRIDKQRAYLGDIQLGQCDPIRAKIKFSSLLIRSRGIYSLCKEIGIVP